MYYKLDENHNPIPVDMMEWAKGIESDDRQVAITIIQNIRVSTVFLGLDHAFSFGANKNPKPILFETMVFGGRMDQYMKRYTTWELAEQGHKIICDKVAKSITVWDWIKYKFSKLFI